MKHYSILACFWWNRMSSPHKKIKSCGWAPGHRATMFPSDWEQEFLSQTSLHQQLDHYGRPTNPRGWLMFGLTHVGPAMPWSTWSKLVKRAIMLELRIRQQLSQRRRRRWSSSFERAIMLEHQIRRRGYHKPMALAIDKQHEKSELLNCRSRMPPIDVCTEEHQPSKNLLVSESGGFLAF